jgi:predicted dehydrogenase
VTSVRFAVIGCGRVAGNHLEAITTLDRAELAAVCDLVPERADAYAQRYGVPAYTSYHTMLQREHVDVVHIVTPSGMHPTHVVDVIQRYQKHIVVEKPLALRLSDAGQMQQAAEDAGVKIFPVYQNRYNRAVQAVRQAILQGDLGKIAVASVRLHWCRPQRYYDLSPWRGTWAMDGGALTNQGIHYLDLLLYLVGEIEQVSTLTATQFVQVEVEDTGVAAVRFSNGALGTVEITTAARPDDREASISILGEHGMGIIAGLGANQLTVWTPDPSLCARASEQIPNAYGLGHTPLIAGVIADLLDGVPHPLSFKEGVRTIRLLNALYRSAEDGVPVRLNDNLSSHALGRYDEALHALYRAPMPEMEKTHAPA